MKKTLFSLLVGLGLLLSACSTTSRMDPNRTVDFTILQLNDVYEISPLEGGNAGGLARVATVKKELLKENPNTIAILAGDFLSPSLMATLEVDGERIAGLQMVETLNAMGLDYVTFGNHEFDLSDPDLLKKRMDQSEFVYTCSNVLEVRDGKQQPFTQKVNGVDHPIHPYIIREFKNAAGDKVMVGFIGVVLPFNKQDYVHYLPVEETFRKTYEKIKDDVDVVIGITHLSIEQDLELARKVPGVQLFIGGHDHDNMNHYVEKTIIAKADANAKTVYVHRFKFHPEAKMTEIQSSLKKIDASIPNEPATQAVIEKWQSKVTSILTGKGYTPDRKVLEAKTPLICREAVIRHLPTNFGQLTCEAFQYVLPGADVYLINSGSMRLDDDIAGTLVEYDVLRTFPFGGEIVQTSLAGSVLNDMLRIGLLDNIGEGGYFQVLGVKGDPGRWVINGELLDPDKQYKVVLPLFVMEGKEAGLEFLNGMDFDMKESYAIDGKTIANDIRNIVIAYMEHVGSY